MDGLLYLHLSATDGCFSGSGTFTKGPAPAARDLEDLFRYEVLKMLKAEGKIKDAKDKKLLFPPPSMPRQRLCVNNYINTTC